MQLPIPSPEKEDKCNERVALTSAIVRGAASKFLRGLKKNDFFAVFELGGDKY